MSEHSTEKDAPCRHCGKPPEADGDHSCPCPYTDANCPDHPAPGKPVPLWMTRVTPPASPAPTEEER